MQVLKDGQDVRGASCVVVVVVCSVVGSLINYVFGTSTISFCHRVCQLLDGRCLVREVRPYRMSRFQSWSGVKINIGEQREFRLASCHENRSRCCHLSVDVCRGNVT